MMNLRILAVAAMAACGAAMIGATTVGALPGPTTRPVTFADESVTVSGSGLDLSYSQRGHQPGAVVTHKLSTRIWAYWRGPWVWVTYGTPTYSKGGWRHAHASHVPGHAPQNGQPNPVMEILTATADSEGVARFTHHVAVPPTPPPSHWLMGIGPWYPSWANAQASVAQMTLARITYRPSLTDTQTGEQARGLIGRAFILWNNPDAHPATPPNSRPTGP